MTRFEVVRRTALEIVRRMGSNAPHWCVALINEPPRIDPRLGCHRTPGLLIEAYRLWTVPEPPWHGPKAWHPALRTTGTWGVHGPNGEWWVGPRLSRAGARRFADVTGGVAVEDGK